MLRRRKTTLCPTTWVLFRRKLIVSRSRFVILKRNWQSNLRLSQRSLKLLCRRLRLWGCLFLDIGISEAWALHFVSNLHIQGFLMKIGYTNLISKMAANGSALSSTQV
jgi:hypothetical protein